MSLSRRRALNMRSQVETIDEHGSWAISYGDMVTLLLCFFIMFFNVNPIKKEMNHFKVLQEALQGKLMSPKEAANPTTKNVDIGEADDGKNVDKTLLEKLGGVVTVQGDNILVEFPSISFFDLGQIQIRKEGVDVLKVFTELYLPYSGKFRLAIMAYTDDVPVKSKRIFQDNLELSALRSISAMRVLQRAGLPLSVMRVGGYGELTHIRPQVRVVAGSPSLQGEDVSASSFESPTGKFKGNPMARRVMFLIEPRKKSSL